MRTLLLLLALPAAFSFGPNANLSPKRIRITGARKESVLFNPRFQKESKEDACLTQNCAPSQLDRNQHPKVDHRHYSASDWLYNLKTWRNSSVLREVKQPVKWMTIWALLLSLLQKSLLWSGNNKWAMNMCLPHSAHSFLVSSLGLLLVFRTNSAYQRFLEGRKIWEQILTVSRNFSRLTMLYRNEVGKERRQRIQHLLAAFPYLLRHHIRSGCLCSKDPSQIAKDNLLYLDEPTRPEKSCWVDRQDLPWSLIHKAQLTKTDKSLEKIAQVSNRPLWICDRIGKEIMDIPTTANFTSRERLKFLADIERLANAIGSCERIHQTAVPLHYARHALRSLTVWIATLPFSLVRDFGLLTGPVTAVVAWLLFGVYQIGHSIEDPFQGSLQLSALCDDIRRDVLTCEESFEFDHLIEPKIPELSIFAKSIHGGAAILQPPPAYAIR